VRVPQRKLALDLGKVAAWRVGIEVMFAVVVEVQIVEQDTIDCGRVVRPDAPFGVLTRQGDVFRKSP